MSEPDQTQPGGHHAVLKWDRIKELKARFEDVVKNSAIAKEKYHFSGEGDMADTSKRMLQKFVNNVEEPFVTLEASLIQAEADLERSERILRVFL